MSRTQKVHLRSVSQKTTNREMAACDVLAKSRIRQPKVLGIGRGEARKSQGRANENRVPRKKRARGFVIEHHAAFRMTRHRDHVEAPFPGAFGVNIVDFAKRGGTIFVGGKPPLVKAGFRFRVSGAGDAALERGHIVFVAIDARAKALAHPGRIAGVIVVSMGEKDSREIACATDASLEQELGQEARAFKRVTRIDEKAITAALEQPKVADASGRSAKVGCDPLHA